MTIFARVERTCCAPQIVRLAGLYNQVGEDYNGILSTTCSQRLFFAIALVDGSMRLRPYCKELKLNGGCIQVPELSITCNDLLEILEYRISFFSIAQPARSLAMVDALIISDRSISFNPKNQVHLDHGLASLRCSTPIPAGFKATIGSNPENQIAIKLENIAPQHCVIMWTDGQLVLRPLQGRVSCDGTDIETERILVADCTLRLEPTRYALRLRMPPTYSRTD